jgi:hypothetical protein
MPTRRYYQFIYSPDHIKPTVSEVRLRLKRGETMEEQRKPYIIYIVEDWDRFLDPSVDAPINPDDILSFDADEAFPDDVVGSFQFHPKSIYAALINLSDKISLDNLFKDSFEAPYSHGGQYIILITGAFYIAEKRLIIGVFNQDNEHSMVDLRLNCNPVSLSLHTQELQLVECPYWTKHAHIWNQARIADFSRYRLCGSMSSVRGRGADPLFTLPAQAAVDVLRERSGIAHMQVQERASKNRDLVQAHSETLIEIEKEYQIAQKHRFLIGNSCTLLLQNPKASLEVTKFEKQADSICQEFEAMLVAVRALPVDYRDVTHRHLAAQEELSRGMHGAVEQTYKNALRASTVYKTDLYNALIAATRRYYNELQSWFHVSGRETLIKRFNDKFSSIAKATRSYGLEVIDYNIEQLTLSQLVNIINRILRECTAQSSRLRQSSSISLLTEALSPFMNGPVPSGGITCFCPTTQAIQDDTTYTSAPEVVQLNASLQQKQARALCMVSEYEAQIRDEKTSILMILQERRVRCKQLSATMNELSEHLSKR